MASLDAPGIHVLLVSPDADETRHWDCGHLLFEHAADRAALLARLAAPAPDVVILDFILDQAGAFDDMSLINRRWPETPVIVLAAPEDGEVIIAALAAGGSSYIVRTPEDLGQLDFRVRAVLARTTAADLRIRAAQDAARRRSAARLHALNAAGSAVQEARTPAEVYAIVAQELARLDLAVHILQLTPDGATLTVTYTSLQRVREPDGVSLPAERAPLQLPLMRVPTLAQIIGSERAAFVQDLSALRDDMAAADPGAAEFVQVLAEYQEAVIAPMLRGGHARGLLIVTGRDRLAADDVPATTAFANQITIALTNAELFSAAKARAERLRVLNDVGRVLTSTLDALELYSLIHREAARVLAADAFYVALYDEQTETLHFPYQYDYGTILPPQSLPLGEGLASRAVRTRRPVVIRDRDDPLQRAAPSTGDLKYPAVSGLHVPMLQGSRVIGVVSAQTYRADAYSEDDVQVLSIIAGQAAVAIENARLYEEARRRAEEVSALLNISQSISVSIDLDTRLHQIAQAAKDLVSADGCSIYLLRPEQGELRALVALETYEEEVLADPVHIGEGVIGYVARSGVGELVNHLENDPRAVQIPGTPLIVECMIAVPLLVENRVTGVMSVRRESSHEFAPRDLRLLTSFANQAAIAIENAHLFDETRRRAEEVTALLTTTEAIASTLDLDTLLKIVGHHALRLIDGDGCTLWRVDAARAALTPLLVLEPNARAVLDTPLKLGEGLPGTVARTGSGCLVNYVSPEGRLPFEFESPPAPECLIGVPLKIKEQVIGVMTVRRVGARPFVEDDLRLLSSFANQAALAMEKARLYQEVQRQRSVAETLREAARAAGATLRLNEVLDRILAHLRVVVRCDSASIMLRREGELRFAITHGHPDPAQVLASRRLENLATTRQILATRQPLLVADTAHFPGWAYFPGEAEIRSWLGVPLIGDDEVIGILGVDCLQPHGFDEEDADVLMAFASHMAAAIRNANLYEAARRQTEELSVLYQIGLTLGQTLDLRTVLEQGLDLVVKVTGHDLAYIHLLDPERETLHLAALRGEALETTDVPSVVCLGDGQIGQAARQATTIVTPDTACDADLRTLQGEPVPAGSLASVPLSSKGQVLGVLSVGSQAGIAPGEAHIRLLKTIAHWFAVAVENARLYGTLRQRAQTLQRAYDELAEADRLKDEIVQNVSHELRTPLIFIKGYVDLLSIGELGALSDEQREALRVVAHKTEALTRLVDDIMTLQTINRATLRLQSLDVCDLTRRAVQAVQATAEPQDINLVIEIPPQSAVVYGDRHRLQQVLDNLLDNAIKFNVRGGSVVVRVRTTDQRVIVEVADTGIGIPADKLARIFDRFYQVDGSTTRRYGGAGLGLTITRQIVEAHGGEIHVESEVGSGTRFWFSLPLVQVVA